MSYNPITRGLNAISKLITRGFAQIAAYGDKVKICRTWTKPYIDLALSTGSFMCQKLSTKNYIDLKVSTE